MNPLDFYTNPDKLDYEKDVDSIGRDMIRKINNSDYLRTTMYCSGHFQDEEQFPWAEGMMNLCLMALDNSKAAPKLRVALEALRNEFGIDNVGGGILYTSAELEGNYITSFLVEYGTKEGRQRAVDILTDILCREESN